MSLFTENTNAKNRISIGIFRLKRKGYKDDMNERGDKEIERETNVEFIQLTMRVICISFLGSYRKRKDKKNRNKK